MRATTTTWTDSRATTRSGAPAVSTRCWAARATTPRKAARRTTRCSARRQRPPAGEEGNDTLVGGAGDDTIDGGEVTDRINYSDLNTLLFTGATEGVVVDLGAGEVAQDGQGGFDLVSNIVSVVGTEFNDTLTGGTEMGFEQFDGAGGDDLIDGGALGTTTSNRVNYASANAAVTVNLGTGSAFGTATGTDTLVNINQVSGTRYNDTLTGSDATTYTETFIGRAGNDTIDGRGGNDIARYEAAANVSLATGIALTGKAAPTPSSTSKASAARPSTTRSPAAMRRTTPSSSSSAWAATTRSTAAAATTASTTPRRCPVSRWCWAKRAGTAGPSTGWAATTPCSTWKRCGRAASTTSGRQQRRQPPRRRRRRRLSVRRRGGNDTLVGDHGDDLLVGGDGSDIFGWGAGAAGNLDRVEDLELDDSLYFAGLQVEGFIEGMADPKPGRLPSAKARKAPPSSACGSPTAMAASPPSC
ncbi:calcium-binding protein [Ramlibacter terrae]|uniref:Calcium-binding protein n=1 Tax=Ramlibacter terrae TaxID=2732511 RepID=A0ABX6P0T9_9BURK|nr:calcium-binding protein [Ramlibacter terrae]